VLRGITYKPPGSLTFAPKYLDPSTQMYQDLNHSTQMRAFGLDLANSAARALQDTFVKALPYLILVAIVVVTYFVQQRQITARNKNNPTINDSPAAAQQQMIMKIFPIFSGVFAFIVPAALAWYFLVQNVFRIGQQAYITKRFYKQHPDAIVAKRASTPKTAPNAKNAKSTAKPKGGGRNTAGKATTTPPAKAVEPKAKPTPPPSSNGKRREAPKPPPRPTGSTPKPPARPRPQQKKKP